jgi:UDP-3-O-[3-hydroxymyristoyl] glucosamine N-acyltransferase
MTLYIDKKIDIDNPLLPVDGISIGFNTTVSPWVELGERVSIGSNCFIGPFTRILDDCMIGDNTIIGSHNMLERDVHVGSNVTIQPHGIFGVKTFIADDVFIGPHFSHADCRNVPIGPHGLAPNKKGHLGEPISIGHQAILGDRVTVAPGVDIAPNSLIDMNAFVTHSTCFGDHIRGPKEIVARVI